MHYNYKQILVPFFLLTCICLSGRAQKKDIENTNQQWFQYTNQIKFSDKWQLSTDLGYRLKDKFSRSLLYIAGTRMGYRVKTGMRLSLGFTHLGFYTLGRLSQREFRPYQEFALTQKYRDLSVGHRFRTEQRYFRISAHENFQAESNFNHRFRYRLSLVIPILKFPPFSADKKLIFNPAYEIFINAGKEIVYNVFDRHRMQAGLTMQFSKKLSIKMTYVYQFTALNLPRSFVRTNVFWLGISQNFNW